MEEPNQQGARRRRDRVQCAEARHLLGVFVEGGLERQDERLFRSHLTGCAECRKAYRETLGCAARLGRTLRERREAGERDERRISQRTLARKGAFRIRERNFGLRLMLVPAALIVLLTQLHRFQDDELLVHWEAGEVRVAGALLGSDSEATEVFRGDWCVTGELGHAQLVVGHDDALIGSKSRVLVEEPERRRLRLENGAVALTGSWTVTTQQGVVTLDAGAAEVDVFAGKLVLSCREGELRLVDVQGERRIRPGERLEAGQDGSTAALR
jgi:hypothetical protein